jgi:GR25 family glycosyltransferase involved in LPS biosynthesis
MMTSDVALVINLDKRTDRWKYVQKTVQKLGERLERISAVDGHAVKLDSVRLDPVVHATMQTKKRFSVLHIDSRGALGCALSHRKAWQRVLELGTPTLILEDDAEPTEFAKRWIQAAKQAVQHDLWDLVLLGAHKPPSSRAAITTIPSWTETGTQVTGSWAYVVSPRAANILLASTEVLTFQADTALHSAGLRVGFVEAFRQATFMQSPDVRHPPLEAVSKRGFVYAFLFGFLTAALFAIVLTRRA